MRAIVPFLTFASLALSAPPVVTKLEPPDWVSARAAFTLRMLVTGTGLGHSKIRCSFPAERIASSASGTHLFFDLRISSNVAPGNYPIHLTTASGEADIPFTIVPALASAGRFQGFNTDDVIYLIMPDRFANGDTSNDDPAVSRGLYNRSKTRFYHGGDLEGIIQHLSYIKALGATAIWLTPVYDNSNQLNQREKYDNQPVTDYHGYGAVDFYSVDEHLGTLSKFRELVDRAHAIGLKVIQDQVANHTGPYHPWVTDPPAPTWFHGTEARHLKETWRTWTLMDPHATSEMRADTLNGWFAGILPDLNQDDPECAQYLIQNTLWWIGRTGLDGIREDTLPYVPRSFWSRWTAAIHRLYPRVNVVGEVFDADPGLVAFFQAGTKRFDGVDGGVDTLFDFPLMGAVRSFFSGSAPASDLAKVIAHDSLYRDPSRLVTFAGLHDTSRFLNLPGATAEELKNIFTFLMTVRGIPMIYYGDEIGMTGGDDPDNRRDYPGGWKGDSRNAFEREGRTAEQESLIEHLRLATSVRARLEPLRRGAMVELLAETDQYAFARKTERDSAVVVFNRAAEPVELKIPLAAVDIADGAALTDAMRAGPAVMIRDGVLAIRMPAHSAAIYH